MGKDITYRVELEGGEATRRALMRLGDDGQKALNRIERAGTPVSKSLLAVDAVTGRLRAGMSGMADRFGAFGSSLAAFGPAGIAASLAIGATTIAITRLAKASITAAQELAAIKDEAQQAGAAVETYQALRYAAEEYSVSQSALTDGLKELNLRADEWITTGGGPAAEAFKRLGFTQKELQGQLSDTGELFLQVVRRMQGLESEAARIRVADEIFGGTGGEQFVRMVAAGEEAIRSMMAEARELGFVIDRNLIERADETRDKMNQLQRLIDLQLNSALVDLAPIALNVAEAFADVARFVADVVDGFRDLENQSTRGLQRRMEDLDEFFSRNPNPPSGGHALRNWRQKFDERERLLQIQMERAAADNQRRSAPSVSAPTDESDKEAEKIDKVTEALRFRLEQMNRTEYGKRVYQELQRAGIDANHREAQTIAELVFKVQTQEQAEKAAAKAKQDGEAMTKSVMSAEEKRIQAIAEINRLLQAGVISEETATRARDVAAQEFRDAEMEKLRSSREASDGIRRALIDLRNESTNLAHQWETDIQGMNQTARSAFVDITTGAKSMSDGLMSILNDLQRRIMGRVWDRTMGSLLDGIIDIALDQVQGAAFSAGMGRSGISSGISTPSFTLHTGGTVGKDSSGTRFVAPDLFAGAPRFHGGGLVPGLRPGEMPIIAMNGERVLTEAQQANTARTIAGLAALAKPSTPGVSVTVNNTAGRVAEARANVSQGRDGGLDLEIIVEEIEHRMTRNVARGEGMAGTLERRYGLDPAVGARR